MNFRKIRIAIACVFFIGMTLLLVGIGKEWFGWMAKLQFLPSCLALNFVTIATVLLLTLLLGRVYCSVICPLGVFQDIIIALRRKTHAKKKFVFSKERKLVRYVVLSAAIGSVVASFQVLIALVAPYSAYGRIVSSLCSLVTGTRPGWILLATSGITLALVSVCSWMWGRAWCNSICPVGTVLGYVSRLSLFKMRIDESKCVSCGLCAKRCKAYCIDPKEHRIDYSRCVDCFDCIDNCSSGAIGFVSAWKSRRKKEETSEEPSSKSRRAFISTGALLIGTAGVTALNAQEKNLDGGLAPIEEKQNPERIGRLVPPGAQGEENFYSRCTACQLCVNTCPNNVLRPSTDLEHLLQPQMGYEKGFCRPECTACSQVCPSGAIKPITADQKTSIHIGTAEVDTASCIACGKCKTVCPTGAITIIRTEDGKKTAAVFENQCIGCGKCEFLCPVRPISAIKVNALKEHRNG